MRDNARGKRIFTVLILVLGIAALAGFAQPAQACMGGQCCECQGCGPSGCTSCECGPCGSLLEARLFGVGHQTQVEFLSRDQARLIIKGFLTTHLETGFECITTLSPVPGIRSIDSVVNYNTLTGQPFPELTFSEDFAAAQGASEIAEGAGVVSADGPWQGFISHIVGSVEDGVLNHFVVDVTLEEGVRPEDLLKALREYGTYITASSEGGYPNGGHEFVRLLGDNPVFVVNEDLGLDQRSPRSLP